MKNKSPCNEEKPENINQVTPRKDQGKSITVSRFKKKENLKNSSLKIYWTHKKTRLVTDSTGKKQEPPGNLQSLQGPQSFHFTLQTQMNT